MPSQQQKHINEASGIREVQSELALLSLLFDCGSSSSVSPSPTHPCIGETFMSVDDKDGGSTEVLTREDDEKARWRSNSDVSSKKGGYTTEDVKQAYLQVIEDKGLGYDDDFVDFVMGGCIRDELDVYRERQERRRKVSC
mmetsp:Transcript_18474/g.39959  ORF Transcript_18474/g.39959 Transcript_18474/m.39959 type:complete len:140 (+) Transcript_18474:3361-3780(+)